MSKRYLYIIAIAACFAIPALYFYNPADYIWMPKCPTKALLGIDCPGCGFQRAAHALLHGQFKKAIGYNPFFVVAFPYLLSFILCGLMKKGELQQKIQNVIESKFLTYGYITIFFIWFIFRNVYNM